MHEQRRTSMTALLCVIVGLVLLALIASGGVTWAAPSSQGSVPTPPKTEKPPETPPRKVTDVPPETPLPTPTPGPVAVQSSCCLSGVAFTALREDREEIYIMKDDGSAVTRLSTLAALDRNPAASLDGKRIAFESSRDDPDPLNCGKAGKPNCILHIYTMNVDGTDVRRLTTGPGQDSQPAWSMGSARIAFVSNFEDPNLKTCGQAGQPACVFNIYVMNADGSGIIRLTASVPGNPNASSWGPNWSPDDRRIAFTSNRDGNDEVYVTYSDGTGLVRLTNTPTADSHPAWSPDARQLAFESNRDGKYQIYVMNADGSNVTRITRDTSDDRRPIWFPGCVERIIYVSNQDGGVYRIYTIDPNGANPIRLTSTVSSQTAWDDMPTWSGLPETYRVAGPCCVPGVAFDSLRDGNEEIYIVRSDGLRLTRLTNNPARDMLPAPSPNGQQIAFQSNRDGKFQIYLMNVDGSGTVRLTSGAGDDTGPIWSYDGTRIAFVSSRDDANPASCGQPGKAACVTHLYVMNADGSAVKRITNNPTGADSSPFWLLDGTRLIFQSNRDGNDEIYSVSLDGSGLTRITNDKAGDGHPSVSPDGLKIAFESDRDGKYQIYVMDADGTNAKRLTDKGENRRPYWCPSCSERIVFSSNRDGGSYSIYTMKSDGTEQVRLTTPAQGAGTTPDDDPAWSGLPVTLPVPIASVKPVTNGDAGSTMSGWLNRWLRQLGQAFGRS